MSTRVTTRTEGEERVTPLELFFDLVFVFAITQVTGLVSANPTWTGVAEGIVVLALLWWAWAAYSWRPRTVDPGEGVFRLSIFGAMGAMLLASLAVPHAFGDDAWLFVASYVAVRVAHLALYAVAGRGDKELLGAITRLSYGAMSAAVLLVVGAAAGGHTQIVLWGIAILIDALGALIRGG